jgi:hypothetical protein
LRRISTVQFRTRTPIRRRRALTLPFGRSPPSSASAQNQPYLSLLLTTAPTESQGDAFAFGVTSLTTQSSSTTRSARAQQHQYRLRPSVQPHREKVIVPAHSFKPNPFDILNSGSKLQRRGGKMTALGRTGNLLSSPSFPSLLADLVSFSSQLVLLAARRPI